jgi:hypothetical protein
VFTVLTIRDQGWNGVRIITGRMTSKHRVRTNAVGFVRTGVDATRRRESRVYTILFFFFCFSIREQDAFGTVCTPFYRVTVAPVALVVRPDGNAGGVGIPSRSFWEGPGNSRPGRPTSANKSRSEPCRSPPPLGLNSVTMKPSIMRGTKSQVLVTAVKFEIN